MASKPPQQSLGELNQLKQRVALLENLADTLLLVVAEMAAEGQDRHAPVERNWAQHLLNQLEKYPNVSLNRELRTALERKAGR